MGRSNDDNDDDDSSFGKHPALRNFNRTGFMVRHVAKAVLKWGAIGAVAAVAGAAVMTMAAAWMGGIVTAIAAVASVIFPELRTLGAEFGINTAMYSAAGGGIIGAAVGGIVAISGVSEAADAEEDRLVAKYEQQEARRERMMALERRRDEQRYAMERQAESMRGPGAQLSLPRGRQGQGMGHANV
jgi:hypothetical protein